MTASFLSNLNLIAQTLSFTSPSCKYFSDFEFRDGCVRHDAYENFKLFHLNIRSLNANHDKLFQYMAALNFPFDIIILSEIWSFNIDTYKRLLPDYNFYYILPNISSIGGIGVYLKKSFTAVIRDDFRLTFPCPNNSAEILFLEVVKNDFKCLIGCFYRHPSYSISQFTTYLELTFQSALFRKFQECCFLAGDFNVDILKYDTNHEVSRFVDLLISFNFFPLSTIPTRVTDTSATIIDHVYYRSNLAIKDCIIDDALNGCLSVDISDHLANFIVLPLLKAKNINKDRPFTRIFSKSNKEKFNNLLLNADWSTRVYNHSDVNVAYANFLAVLRIHYEECFPLTKISRKRIKDKRWITPELIKSSNYKNALYKKWIISKSPFDKEKYKAYLKIFNKSISSVQAIYYRPTFDSNLNSIKSLWKEINKLVCFNSQKNCANLSTIPKINVNGSLINESNLIANELNNYFCNVGADLVAKLPHISSVPDFNFFLPPSVVNSFACLPITQDEIHKLIIKFNSKNSSGPDIFNARFIYDFEQVILSPLCFIFNLSLSIGVFPDELKKSKTIRIFKKGDHTIMSNYRPISLLSIFSKILESLVSARLSSFLTKYNILYEYQFGFRSNYSTKLALVNSVDDILKALNEKQLVAGIFFDLAKAFDSIDHLILIDKLHCYGIRGQMHKWFCSYLEM